MVGGIWVVLLQTLDIFYMLNHTRPSAENLLFCSLLAVPLLVFTSSAVESKTPTTKNY